MLSGSWRSCCATISRADVAAALISMPEASSTVIRDDPKLELDEIVLIPSSALSASSSTEVTSVSTVCGSAPS